LALFEIKKGQKTTETKKSKKAKKTTETDFGVKKSR